jgi:monoamine oxidase
MIADGTPHTIDILIIGAGAAGLLAARELAAAGRRVCLLEARDRVGGRVHTIQPAGFTQPIEAGAEFMHGDVPLTKSLLQEAGIKWAATAGRTYQLQHGQVHSDTSYFAQLPQLLAKLEELAEDMPLAAFLTQEFPGEEHATLRTFATQFAEMGSA